MDYGAWTKEAGSYLKPKRPWYSRFFKQKGISMEYGGPIRGPKDKGTLQGS